MGKVCINSFKYFKGFTKEEITKDYENSKLYYENMLVFQKIMNYIKSLGHKVVNKRLADIVSDYVFSYNMEKDFSNVESISYYTESKTLRVYFKNVSDNREDFEIKFNGVYYCEDIFENSYNNYYNAENNLKEIKEKYDYTMENINIVNNAIKSITDLDLDKLMYLHIENIW